MICIIYGAISLRSTDCGPTNTEVIANLASAVASRSSIIDLHTFQLEQIEEACLKVPSLDVIKADAARLQSVLTPQFDQSASEAAFLQELEDACKLLESADVNDDTLEQILGRDARPGIDLRQELDVNDVLETAWSLDQAAIMDGRGKVLVWYTFCPFYRTTTHDRLLRQYLHSGTI